MLLRLVLPLLYENANGQHDCAIEKGLIARDTHPRITPRPRPDAESGYLRGSELSSSSDRHGEYVSVCLLTSLSTRAT
jgi:hypothetical protein